MKSDAPSLRVTRSFSLLSLFVVSGALILAMGAAALGSLLSGALCQQAVDDAEREPVVAVG